MENDLTRVQLYTSEYAVDKNKLSVTDCEQHYKVSKLRFECAHLHNNYNKNCISGISLVRLQALIMGCLPAIVVGKRV